MWSNVTDRNLLQPPWVLFLPADHRGMHIREVWPSQIQCPILIRTCFNSTVTEKRFRSACHFSFSSSLLKWVSDVFLISKSICHHLFYFHFIAVFMFSQILHYFGLMFSSIYSSMLPWIAMWVMNYASYWVSYMLLFLSWPYFCFLFFPCYPSYPSSQPPGEMSSSDEESLSERSCVSERSFRSERSGGSLSPCAQSTAGPKGDTLPWNLSKHERRKRKSQDSVLDPAERAVVRVAGKRFDCETVKCLFRKSSSIFKGIVHLKMEIHPFVPNQYDFASSEEHEYILKNIVLSI